MELLPILAPSIFVLVFAALAFFLYFHNRKKERERTEQLRAVAAQLAWRFADEAPFNMIAGLEHFTLFNQGHSKEIKNFMYGEANGVKAAVFDYVFVTGSGKHRHTHHQSVTYLEPAHFSVPFFSLRPEGFMTKLFQAFGYQDIDFGQRPEFSKQYLLRGPDEPGIRRTFNDRLLSFFESYHGTCVDGGGNQLFIFRAGHRFQPQEIQPQLALALNIFALLQRY
jgi:hypothetical protein